MITHKIFNPYTLCAIIALTGVSASAMESFWGSKTKPEVRMTHEDLDQVCNWLKKAPQYFAENSTNHANLYNACTRFYNTTINFAETFKQLELESKITLAQIHINHAQKAVRGYCKQFGGPYSDEESCQYWTKVATDYANILAELETLKTTSQTKQ